MDRRHAIFRADASIEIGGGHIMRCLALADALARNQWRCSFIGIQESSAVVEQLRHSRHAFMALDGPDMAASGAVVEHGPADALIIDHYGLDHHFERGVRDAASCLAVLDDFPARDHIADLLVDQTHGRTCRPYEPLVPDHSAILAGSGYALLRAEFETARELAYMRSRFPVQRALISFGATDPWGLSIIAARSALAAGIARVDIAIGARAPKRGELERFCQETTGVELHVNAAMAPLMASADIAVGAGGSTAWERCCVGLPTVVVAAAANQKDVTASLTAAGAAVAVPPGAAFGNDLTETLRRLTGDAATLAELSKRAGQLVDGFGARRVTAALADIRCKRGNRVWLHPVAMTDAELLYEWQSAPNTRRYARVPQVPPWPEHLAWLENKLEDFGCLFHLVMTRAGAVGFLRLDWQSKHAETGLAGHEVSIATAPSAYGQGFAAAALRLARELVPCDHLLASVMAENAASRALFLQSGYRETAPGWYVSKPRADA